MEPSQEQVRSATHAAEQRIHQVFVVSITLKGAARADRDRRRRSHSICSAAPSIADWIDQLGKNDWLALRQHFPLGNKASTLSTCSATGGEGVLVIGLLKQKLWAYPASFAVFGLFIAYQLYATATRTTSG